MGRIVRISSGVRAGVFGVLLAASLVQGQETAVSSASPQTVVDVLHQLSDKAEVIFAGQVMAIRHTDGGVVEVEFRVDQAIRGCRAGTPYFLREWAGLWEGGTERYRVGQQLLMLLYAPGAAGMSSPVGGLDGAIPIRQGGAGGAVDDAATPRQPPYVDLRWLGARLPRAVSYRSSSAAAKPAGLAAPFSAHVRTANGAAAGNAPAPIPSTAGRTGSSGSSVPAQQASVDAVLGMLTTWQKAEHGTP